MLVGVGALRDLAHVVLVGGVGAVAVGAGGVGGQVGVVVRVVGLE